MWCRGTSGVVKVPGAVSGHLCVCSLPSNVQGHMVTICEEQNPTLRPEMTMPSQGFGPKTSGPQSKTGPTEERNDRRGHGRVKMCATGGTAPQVNRRLKYTEILGKRVACLRKWALALGSCRATVV
ncbi:hypothetical protein BDQ94DRAFT_13310 [Aspergillus welwitschiae]|uniref:Uncharacterized protein n=1 Tax=Aspergillus welwitschiae TaxID=1341132 RepID=A0A3F3PI31_9EURO|nr:hypothetical protein BDQ94DRAFT_13310 [Aspergillus welwitschiae]RDH26568.1 hypothetical protein BDQ94DRAFT_13310 [Aspergillus welwitschiae]